MNTQPDNSLRDLFQRQRQHEAEKAPAFVMPTGRDGGLAIRLRMLPRMALAASIMLCIGLTLAARLWFISIHTEPSTEWAALAEWSPATDALLELAPASISDTIFFTDGCSLDEMYSDTQNQQEVL